MSKKIKNIALNIYISLLLFVLVFLSLGLVSTNIIKIVGAQSTNCDTPKQTLTAPPNQVRVAENPCDFVPTLPWLPFDGNLGFTILNDYQFKDPTPGIKFIWAQFRDPEGHVDTKGPEQIEYLGPPPVMTGLNCSINSTGKGVNFVITGLNFSDKQGSVAVTSNSQVQQLRILNWKPNQISGTLDPTNPVPANGQEYQVLVLRADNQATDAYSCIIGVSQISLGAKLFCREPSKNEQPNVKLNLWEDVKDAKPVNQTVTIDKNGNIQNLSFRLQPGKDYILGLKAPKSLFRVSKFKAQEGTTIVGQKDNPEAPFILPVGDIFPLEVGDGVINTLDKSELNREFVTLVNAPNRAADFNQDQRVNSIDWACMRYDFNAENDPQPIPGGESSDSASLSCPLGQFKAEYYTFTSAEVVDGFPVIDFDSKTPLVSKCERSPLNYQVGVAPINPEVPADNFAARWTGQFYFAAPGNYQFNLEGDDGMKVYLDDKLILDEWPRSGPTNLSGVENVTAGNHTIKVEFYEAGGDARAQLDWIKVADF